jgi:hypothetical protein
MTEENNEVQTPDFSGEEMKMPENTDAQPEVKQSTGVVNGPLLIILTLLLVLILGGMYYWFNSLSVTVPVATPAVERPAVEENNEPESTTAEAQVETLQAVSTSDEISAIEADIEATDLDSLDAELNAIDAELDAAL